MYNEENEYKICVSQNKIIFAEGSKKMGNDTDRLTACVYYLIGALRPQDYYGSSALFFFSTVKQKYGIERCGTGK